MPVPDILYLKLNCPVLLLRNLSDHLVNGLKGKANEEVSVYFESLSKDIKIKPETFTVYSALKEQVVASRIQFPISLAFSMATHKAQGLTLDRIEVDGDNIFSAGQL